MTKTQLEEKLTVYQKLQKIRVELQNMQIKKTGKNQKFNYYELADILPPINVLCDKYGLFTKFTVDVFDGVEKAFLVVSSSLDSKDSIMFVCPTAEVKLPSGQPIQNLGSKITYMRRYMLMTAFEIVESDSVDAINEQINGEPEVEEADVKLINECTDVEDLRSVCAELKNKYKATKLMPLFNSRKAAILQEAE